MDKTDKRRKYDEAFKAKALRVARENRSTQAAARARNIRPELLYEWQKAAQAPLPADPAEARPRCASCGPPTGGWSRSWKF